MSLMASATTHYTKMLSFLTSFTACVHTGHCLEAMQRVPLQTPCAHGSIRWVIGSMPHEWHLLMLVVAQCAVPNWDNKTSQLASSCSPGAAHSSRMALVPRTASSRLARVSKVPDSEMLRRAIVVRFNFDSRFLCNCWSFSRRTTRSVGLFLVVRSETAAIARES